MDGNCAWPCAGKTLLGILLSLAWFAATEGGDATWLLREDLFVSGEEGYTAYRIPSLFV